MSLPTKVLVKSAKMLGSALCRQRHRATARSIHAAFTAFRYRFENVDFNFNTNGEKRVLQRLAIAKPVTIFDVGANIGDYALLASRLCTGAIIHAFEPLLPTFDILKNRLAGKPRIRLNNLGLGACEQVIQLHHSGGGDVYATAFPLGSGAQGEAPAQVASVRIVSGRDYVKSAGVSKVDFLKMDVEGMEYEVMRGFGDFLASNVDCIQFEYGVCNIASHYLLRDICSLLFEQGFTVGKVFPKFVDFFDYHFTREDFLGNNFVAVRRERKDLIQLLAR